jgi:hypothetical protein
LSLLLGSPAGQNLAENLAENLDHDLVQTWADHYRQKRAVRGLAVVPNPLEPIFLSFERENSHKPERLPPGHLSRFSYAQLEGWQDWNTAQLEAPLHLLSNMTVLYDPTGYLGRIQKMLSTLEPHQIHSYQKRLLDQARARLTQAQNQLLKPGHQLEQHIEALLLARALLRNHLYPALFAQRRQWFESRLHFPETLRQIGAIVQPKAVYHLDTLYGFGGELEAKKLIQATRGLNLTGVEKAANRALERGYYDGVVMMIRDASAKARAEDIPMWRHLSHSKQARLSLLWGLERCPLGAVALDWLDKRLLELEGN